MKKLFTPLLLCSLVAGALAGGTSGGPWANGAYYSGYLNGKYMGVVTGNNIAGVLGFAILDGAPPFRSVEQQAVGGAGIGAFLLNNQNIEIDNTQNYFAIFVEGRTYAGLTTAGIDISSKTVAGALQGTAPAGSLPAGPGGGAVLAFDSTDALSIINRGLSGGFTAKIKSEGSTFTFKGDGQLSTPANRQTYTITAIPEQVPAFPPPTTIPAGTITNEVVSGVYQTESSPFQVKGIRTSFNAFSPQAAADANAAQAGAATGSAN
jgi:hypothetical protein